MRSPYRRLPGNIQLPAFERYELGSQLRRCTNSVPANLAEGSSSRHIAVFIEGVSGSLGELRETLRHLYIASRKGYLSEEVYNSLRQRYERCGRMLKGLERSLVAKRKGRKPVGNKEEPPAYDHHAPCATLCEGPR